MRSRARTRARSMSLRRVSRATRPGPRSVDSPTGRASTRGRRCRTRRGVGPVDPMERRPRHRDLPVDIAATLGDGGLMSSVAPPPPLPQCPRHRDRVATRACTRCSRPWCGHCLSPAAVGSHCPDCVRAARPALNVRARDAMATRPMLVTKTLMAINIAVFLWVVADQGRAM
jgi:hypothetical protein